MTALFRVWTLLVLSFLSREALATSRFAVHIDGPDAREVKAAIVALGDSGWDVVDEPRLAQAGMKEPALIALCKKMRLDLVLAGRVVGKGKKRVLELVSVADRKRATRYRLALPGEKGLPAAIRGKLSYLFHPGETPPPPEPVVAQPTPEPAEAPPPPAPAPEPAPKATKPVKQKKQKKVVVVEEKQEKDTTPAPVLEHHLPLFQVSIFFDITARRFGYHQLLTNNLASYSTRGLPLVGADVEVYPLAHTSIKVGGDFGIYGDFARSVYGKASATGGTDTISDTLTTFDAGLRYRGELPGDKIRPLIKVSLGAGGSFFEFSDTGSLASQLTEARYVFIRPALGLEIPIWRLRILADFGYRGVVASGQLDKLFPHEHVQGIDVDLGLAIKLGAGFEARAVAQYVRMFSSMNSNVGDTYIAGGALDEYITGQFAIAYAR